MCVCVGLTYIACMPDADTSPLAATRERERERERDLLGAKESLSVARTPSFCTLHRIRPEEK